MSRSKAGPDEILFRETLGQEIKKARLRLGISQSELGKRIGHTGGENVNRYEAGALTLNTWTLVKLANALELSAWALIP